MNHQDETEPAPLTTRTPRRCAGAVAGRRAGLCLAVLAACLGVTTTLHSATVRGWRGTIELPTYRLGSEDPNPPFPLINRRGIYPYPMLDDLTDERQATTYQAIFLENEYLKATILPQLGGRLYSLYDKTARRQVFYCNHVVKYGLVGLRGAWISGGIEFNFPNGHTVVTVSPVSSRLFINPDGSATAVVGALDWVTDMHWEVSLRLRPGQARLEQRVTLFNPTALPNLYWYWANAAVPATPDMQFIYPMRVVNPHSFTEIRTYPVWKGVDYSWYRNIRRPTSLFGLEVRRNFFGAYYHDSDFGVVHVADFHQVPGKKVWSWGVAGDGLIWTHLLTDRDGPYNEIQSGRFDTQLTQEFMPPQRVARWTEYWYPVAGLGGGFLEATRDLALNVRRVPPPAAGKARVELRLRPTANLAEARVRVSLGGKPEHEFGPMMLRVARTAELDVPVDDLEAARRQLAVEVTDGSGQVLLRWSAAEPVDGNPGSVCAAPLRASPERAPSAMTIEELFWRGVEEEKRGDDEEAATTYQVVLKRDSGYIPAILKLAWRNYRAMNLAAARALVARALDRDSENPQALYVAGVIDRAAGRLRQSEEDLWASIRFGGPLAAAYAQVGEVAIEQKNYVDAARWLRKASSYDPQDALALADLAVALRRSGKSAEARQAVDEALRIMPLLPQALAEAWRIETASEATTPSRPGLPRPGARGAEAGDWHAVFDPDPQNYLAVAAWYRSLGDWPSADATLATAVSNWPSKSLSPLVDYDLASDAWHEGRNAQASRYLQQAASLSSERVFPARLADAQVLAEVLSHQPQDARALYLLGTFLFARDRHDDAAELWHKALAEGFDMSVLERDLGVYDWRVRHDLKRAAEDYERAIRLAPDHYRLYPDLDEIYAALGDDARRARLFAEAPPSVRDHDVVRVRRVLFLVEQRKFDEALAALADHAFKPWEGGEIVRQMFVMANIAKGRAALQAKDFAAAEQSFRQALQYPEHLGVGKPDQPQNQQALYRLGEALLAEGRTVAAQTAWREVVEETGGDKAASVFRALALERLGRKAEAEAILSERRREAASEEAGPYALYAAGLVEAWRGHSQEAGRDFRRALDRDPSLWQARLELSAVSP